MLNFDVTEEEQQIRDTIRSFCVDELAPIAQRIDDAGSFPVEVFKKLADLGFLGLVIPEKYGGLGSSTLSFAIVIEEIAKVCGSTALGVAAHGSLGSYPIFAFGTEAQRQKYLPQLCAGADAKSGKLALACFGLTEPHAGSDAGNTKTTAVRSGGGWVINGRKAWITNASYAYTCVLTAKTAPGTARGKGISPFVVEAASKGFTVEKEENKLGMRASNTCQLAFEDMLVPEDALLGGNDDGEGFKKFMKTLDGGRITIGALALGLAQGAFERARDYVKQRKQFGKPIGTFQGVSFKIADMAMEIEAARHLVYNAARLKDAGREFSLEASYAKLYSSEVAMRAATAAIQCLGGYGYTREYDVERIMRDAKLCEIGEGSSEVQRLKIARETLGRLE